VFVVFCLSQASSVLFCFRVEKGRKMEWGTGDFGTVHVDRGKAMITIT
jgi:hypothetical protein